MNDNLAVLKGLLEYCEGVRKDRLECVIKHGGNVSAAARELKLSETSVRGMLKRTKRDAAKAGFNLTVSNVPEGFGVKKYHTMTLTDPETGQQIERVRNVTVEREAVDIYEQMLEAWRQHCEQEITPLAATPSPEYTNEDLLCDYTIGDSHIGMYAWGPEAGKDWDSEKGVNIMKAGIDHLVECAPPAKTAFILDLGDYFHADNKNNETVSGNKLDVDGRYKRVIDLGVEAAIHLIRRALQKHETVLWRSAMGNHNEHSAHMLNMAIKQRFHEEPRVIVLDSPAIHHYYQFGVNLLTDTHGHTSKLQHLPEIMAADAPELWGNTKNRVWRTGHVHHESVKDHRGCKVMTLPVLPPNDAWHQAAGYRSAREMVCTVYHKHTGRVSSNYVNPLMLNY